ncbi:predicted protein [Naegleria gruberi]|uniref:Predicted protein n=1 Tax=Naegleria gruberi TaxID=5762 RepID=D2VFB7_NAEGR|nr:uncharacterized protein NAEGRDRAFT_67570 [Naegleria gruberi]EFC44341.1 predicted protein [Naegleria gruberi]|eukprot:XP_002677085.1 predicted protein [Naegleria gruberi strain NEG-M]
MRGNTIRILQTNESHSTLNLTIPGKVLTVQNCSQRKWLILGLHDGVHIYNSENLSFIGKIERRDFYNFLIDSNGEHMFYRFSDSVSKIRIDDRSVLWTVKEAVECFTICKSKNELFIAIDSQIVVLDMNNGSVKRKIPFLKKVLKCLYITYDEVNERIYL